MNKLIFLVFITTLFCSCKTQTGESNANKGDFSIKLADSLTLTNTAIMECIDQYILQDSVNQAPKVYKVLVEEKDFNLFLTINSVNNYNVLIDHFFAIGYFVRKNKVVVVNNRLESAFRANDKFTDELQSVIRQNVGDSFFDSTSSVYDPPVWKLMINQDTLIVDKHGLSPDIRFKKIIKLDPPKIK